MSTRWLLRVEKVRPPVPLAPGTVLPLAEDVVVGRGADADLVIADDRISRHHARLAVREDGLWIEPLGRGSVFVGGDGVAGPRRLVDGDWLQLGAVLFRVVGRSGPALLSVDPVARRAWLADRPLALRPAEYRLLATLAGRPLEWIGAEALAAEIWSDDPRYANPAYVDKYVSYVRRAVREALAADERLASALRDAIAAAADGAAPAAEPAALGRALVRARKKVGFRLQLSPGRVVVLE